MEIFGGVETGGTKCVCIVASSPSVIYAETQFATESPKITVEKIISFFQAYEKESKRSIASIGVASFGPIDLNPDSPTYGFITATPKPGWSNFNLIGSLKTAFEVPIAFDTDTNGAALGEYFWGMGQGLKQFIYMTIGTGIGGGGILNGVPIHGLVHPEMGHILVPHDTNKDPFAGVCPFHGDCLEGLASGPAIEKRWGVPAQALKPDHPAWQLEATYLAYGLHNLICSLSPERLILGGGVMKQAGLIEKVRSQVKESLAGYITHEKFQNDINSYIVRPGLGDRAGVLGAIALAKQVFDRG